MKKALCLLLSILFLLAPLGSFTVAAVELEVPVVIGTRVSLGEDFTVRFYIRVPAGGENVRASVGGVTYNATPTEEEGVYVVTYPHVPLTAMTEELAVIPSCRLNNQVLKGAAYGFSLRDYAMRLLAQDEVAPELRRVLVAMLNYGAAVQVYAAYRPSNLANDYLTAADRVITPREYVSAFAMGGEPTQNAATLASASMVIGKTASFIFYLNVAGQERLRMNGGSGFPEWQTLSQEKEAAKLAEGIVVEVADNLAFENASSFPIEKAGYAEGYHCVSAGIYATEYGRPYYVRVRTAEGVSSVIAYSVETYVARNLDSAEDENNERLLIAMIEYGDAVSAYRASLAEA